MAKFELVSKYEGIILSYGIADDDHTENERKGGFGSTDRQLTLDGMLTPVELNYIRQKNAKK